MAVNWNAVRRKIRRIDHKICKLMLSQHGVIVTAGTTIACLATLQFHAILGIVFSTVSLWCKDMGIIWGEIQLEEENLELREEGVPVLAETGVSDE